VRGRIHACTHILLGVACTSLRDPLTQSPSPTQRPHCRRDSLDELALPLLSPIATLPPNRQKSKRQLLATQGPADAPQEQPSQQQPGIPALERQQHQQQHAQERRQAPSSSLASASAAEPLELQPPPPAPQGEPAPQEQQIPQALTAFKSSIHQPHTAPAHAHWHVLEQVCLFTAAGTDGPAAVGALDLEEGVSILTICFGSRQFAVGMVWRQAVASWQPSTGRRQQAVGDRSA